MLKKETRILGISTTLPLKAGIVIVGTIFRGSSWLDGILTCTLGLKNDHRMLQLSGEIISSRQYSQLHAVIISKNQTVLQRDNQIAELARRLKLPVIILLERASVEMRNHSRGVNEYYLDINGEQLRLFAKGVGIKEIRELFTVCCVQNSCVPEAVRVADLITKQVNRRGTEPETSNA